MRLGARAAGAMALAALLACADQGERPPPAPVTLRGTIVMEPPRIGIGDTAIVEVAVISPPGYRVAPVPTPKSVEGFSILGAEAPVIERRAGRWIHRTRFQIRARRTGSFAWPAAHLEVEAPDGARSTVEIPERPRRVDEVSEEFPGRQVFFPVRTPPPQRWTRGVLLPAAAGALLALSAVGLFALASRVRGRRSKAVRTVVDEDPTPWRVGWAALASACQLAPMDPCRAADMASAALRLYLSRRFRTPAIARTTEELEVTEPPRALADRWPELLALLRALDGVRFLPLDERRGEQAAAAVRAAQAWMADLEPRDGWR